MLKYGDGVIVLLTAPECPPNDEVQQGFTFLLWPGQAYQIVKLWRYLRSLYTLCKYSFSCET